MITETTVNDVIRHLTRADAMLRGDSLWDKDYNRILEAIDRLSATAKTCVSYPCTCEYRCTKCGGLK